MPPHLHPRSSMTSSLFATTVAASFLVVAMPHVLPCPVPTTRYADGEIVVDENGKRRRWRRRTPTVVETEPAKDSSSSSSVSVGSVGGIVQFSQGGDPEDLERERARKRECPVPKPGGVLGEWLGFHRGEAEGESQAGMVRKADR